MARYLFYIAFALAVIVPTLNAADKITCSVCRGNIDSQCLLNPELSTDVLQCDKCAIYVRILENGQTLFDIQRDCAYRIFPTPIPEQYENRCKSDNAHFIECTHTCSTSYCANNVSVEIEDWTENGKFIGTDTKWERYEGGNTGALVTESLALIIIALLSITQIYWN